MVKVAYAWSTPTYTSAPMRTQEAIQIRIPFPILGYGSSTKVSLDDGNRLQVWVRNMRKTRLSNPNDL